MCYDTYKLRFKLACLWIFSFINHILEFTSIYYVLGNYFTELGDIFIQKWPDLFVCYSLVLSIVDALWSLLGMLHVAYVFDLRNVLGVRIVVGLRSFLFMGFRFRYEWVVVGISIQPVIEIKNRILFPPFNCLVIFTCKNESCYITPS